MSNLREGDGEGKRMTRRGQQHWKEEKEEESKDEKEEEEARGSS